jgi:signal transduction histidine kinase
MPCVPKRDLGVSRPEDHSAETSSRPLGGAQYIDALVRFARVVSDTDAEQHVLSLLADALVEYVCPDGVAVFALGPDGKLRLAAEKGAPRAADVVADIDEASDLAEKVRAACGDAVRALVSRPLVAGGNLYGHAVMLRLRHRELDDSLLPVADAFVDLAAMALNRAAHVKQLERQFAELREQQEFLARTEKLRALGQMAAGISHDLKNILNPLSLHIQVITRALDRGSTADAKESALEMKDVLSRGLQTLERLREFSRQSKETKSELVELDRLAREALSIGKSSSSGCIPRIREELTGPPAVMAVSSEIVSALVNLIVNAIDAMSTQKIGTITLRSGDDGRGSWIEVEDDGPGMPQEVAQRIFEPFFTTKGQKGTGLGLAMVYATMQRHGGTVTVDTAPGKGARFRLWFPAASPASSGASSARPRT